MHFKTGLALCAIVIISGESTAKAVVSTQNQDLNVKTAPPALCYIEMWNEETQDMTAPPSSACSGTLIRTNRVLTAGHCVPGLKSATSTRVTCNNGSQMFGIKAVEADPQYAGANTDPDQDLHDVALIDLEGAEKPGSKKFIAPMELATDAEITAALENPSECQLWGYGRDDDSNTDQSWGTLRGASIDYIDAATWKGLKEGPAQEREFFIGPTVYAGPGDSGGPIVCPSANGGMIQIATTMIEGDLTKGPNKGFHYSAHEKVSYNLGWINQTADLPSLPTR